MEKVFSEIRVFFVALVVIQDLLEFHGERPVKASGHSVGGLIPFKITAQRIL
jgi:hypothetical protein